MSTRLLLGTYTSVTHLVEFTAPTPESLPSIRLVQNLPIPRASWITRHPLHRDIWYIAHEVDDEGGVLGGIAGKVWVYRISPEGQAVRLGEISARDNPCHLEVIAGGIGLAVANFAAGSALLIPLLRDGRFADGSDNHFKLPSTPNGAAKCHQCIDVAGQKQCWLVDTGGGCITKMAIHRRDDGVLSWTLHDTMILLEGHGPRQGILSRNGAHLYTLHARSCLVSHHDLENNAKLISTHNILPGEPIDLANRSPPFTIAAALNYHESSSTLIATSRFVKDVPTDSVAFLHVEADGKLSKRVVKQPKRGKEYRGVGIVGNCYLVAGQQDGWISCFEWLGDSLGWEERDLDPPVRFDDVVDVKAM